MEIMAKSGLHSETYKEQIDFFIQESEAGLEELNEYKINLNKS